MGIVARWCNTTPPQLLEEISLRGARTSGETSERGEEERERESMDARFIHEPITPRRYLFIILLNVDRWGAKAGGSFLQHGHCSEIFVWFNEHAWVAPRSPSFDTRLCSLPSSDGTCTANHRFRVRQSCFLSSFVYFFFFFFFRPRSNRALNIIGACI